MSKTKVVVYLLDLYPNLNEELTLAKELNFTASLKVFLRRVLSLKWSLLYALYRVRFETGKCLISAKPPYSNLTYEETKALRNSGCDPDSRILPTDKGNATVILNKAQYTSTIMELLMNGSYIPVVGNPTLVRGKFLL
ncbi:hypothetical protein Trydic_g15143 [Trypoxylus dichotomus]